MFLQVIQKATKTIKKNLHEKYIRQQVKILCLTVTPEKILSFTEKNQDDIEIIKDELRRIKTWRIHEGGVYDAESLSTLLNEPLTQKDYASLFEARITKRRESQLNTLKYLAEKANIQISPDHIKQMISNYFTDQRHQESELEELKKEFALLVGENENSDPFIIGRNLLSAHKSQLPTGVENPEDFKETIRSNQTCPECKESTLRQSEHLGLTSERCLNPDCKHQDIYSR